MTPANRRVGLYARISSDRPSKDDDEATWVKGQGVDRQLDDLRELARTKRERVVAEFRDNNESAYRRSKPRPQYTAMVEAIKAGDIDTIYAWHPDRLYRSLRDLEELVDLIEAHNLVVRTVKAGDIDLSTPTGRMIARVVGSMARYESEHGAERRARKHAEIAKDGKPSGGGRRPFGYAHDQVTLIDDEAQALREAAEDILAGQTLAEAARRISVKLDRQVRPNILRNTLTGPRIVGLRQYIPAADRRRGVTTPTKLVPATWPAILDRQVWDDVRDVLLDPRRKKTRPPRAYLLSYVLHCGICGQPLTGGNGAYKCSTTTPGGCGKLGVTMAPVDKIVTEWARAEGNKPSAKKQLAKLQTAKPPATSTDSSDAIEERMSTLAAMFADGQISADEWRTARDRLTANLGRAQEHDADRTRRAQLAKRTAGVLAAWDESSIAERRAAITALLDLWRLRLVVEPRSKRNGSRFDTTRVQFRPVED